MVTLRQRSLVLTCAPKSMKDPPLLSLALAAQAPVHNCILRLLRTRSHEAQTMARTVRDLALPSLPSKNNCSRSSLQITSNPWSFPSSGGAVTSPPPSPRLPLPAAGATRGLMRVPAAASHRHKGSQCQVTVS